MECTRGSKPEQSNKQKKETEELQLGKEVIILCLCTGDIIICEQYSKESTKKLLTLRNEFVKIAGYTSIHKKQKCFYIVAIGS